MTDQTTPPRYWFRAKRYGWGWGLPASWEGWLFLLIWLPLAIYGTLWIAQRGGSTASNVAIAYCYLALMISVLLIVCFKKGEPPRWRWGEKD